MNRTIVSRLSVLLALGFAAACSPVVATRGNIVDTDRVAQIKVGQSRMEDVSGLLGSPSQVGTFDDTVWYYIGQRTERTAFLEPEVVDRRVVVVHFDSKGVVSDVKAVDGMDTAQEVEIVDRSTPTRGREMTFFEQLLGNVGRFSTKQSGGTNVLRTPGM
jgi:outer membrane protein assembly factor BamE (lipoprotein component of BamABCDE complex)